MLEVAIALFILTLGLLGLLGLNVVAQQAEVESYQRVQGVILLNDMIERINANRYAASCFAFTDASSGTPYLGVGGEGPPECTVGSNPDSANNAIDAWDELLKGAAELSASSAQIGALPGARGCVSFDAGTGTYTIAVAWQAEVAGFAPTTNCGNGLYGSETKRRVVWATMQIASLR